MEKVFDTLKDVAITLEGIVDGKHGLDKYGYDVSDIWNKLVDGEIALDMYLENEYHQRHTKSRFIKRLISALNSALDLINAALNDDGKEVYHDWLAVAKLCEGWIKEIDDCYKNIPYRAEDFPPGSIARAYLTNLERIERRDMVVPQETMAQEPAAPRPAGRPSQQGKTIKDYMLLKDDDKKDELLMKLHQLIDGQKGTGAAFVILACESLGIMTKPGHTVMINEFPDIGCRSGYDNGHRKGYMNYSREKRTGIEEHLAPFKVAINSNKSPQE